MPGRVLRIAAAAALLLALAACGSQPETRRYTLSGTVDVTRAPPDWPVVEDAGRVFVDPVTVPSYLDRDTIVTRQPDDRLTFATFDVWAEPLAETMTNALVDGLAQRLGPDRVMATPRLGLLEARWRVQVDVLRFDADAAGQLVLDARWTLVDDVGSTVVATHRERLEQTLAEPGSYAERVAASRDLLGRLAQRIAGTIAAA